jgi:hypothetical protein
VVALASLAGAVRGADDDLANAVVFTVRHQRVLARRVDGYTIWTFELSTCARRIFEAVRALPGERCHGLGPQVEPPNALVPGVHHQRVLARGVDGYTSWFVELSTCARRIFEAVLALPGERCHGLGP